MTFPPVQRLARSASARAVSVIPDASIRLTPTHFPRSYRRELIIVHGEERYRLRRRYRCRRQLRAEVSGHSSAEILRACVALNRDAASFSSLAEWPDTRRVILCSEEDCPMIRLTRRVSSLVAFCLLASATSASAE